MADAAQYPTAAASTVRAAFGARTIDTEAAMMKTAPITIIKGGWWICAPLAAVFLSAGFFGVAMWVSFRWLVYLGVVSLLAALLLTVLGLMRDIRTNARPASELQRPWPGN